MDASRRSTVLPALLLGLGIVPAVAGIARLVGLMMGEATAESARFFASPLPVTCHILAVIPYSLLGALQFVPALRRNRWHRPVGAALVPIGLIAAMTGLWMAHFYPWPKGDGEALYLMRLAVGGAMIVSIVRGTLAVLHHDYAAHGAWMTRAYALGMGAGTQVLTHLPWFVFVGSPGEGSRFVLMALGWLINIVVAERVIRQGRNDNVATRRLRTPLASATMRTGNACDLTCPRGVTVTRSPASRHSRRGSAVTVRLRSSRSVIARYRPSKPR